MLRKTLTAVALLAGNAAAKIFYAGVAESGGEFGVYSKSSFNCMSSAVAFTNMHKVPLQRLDLDFQALSALTTSSSMRPALMSTWTRTRSTCSVLPSCSSVSAP